MQYPLANIIVVRQTASTLKDSCFAQLLWAIDKLGLSKYFKTRVSPLEIEYEPTGQRIIFRGLDDVFKTTSITVPKGVLCWGWIEEAYEVSEDSFRTLDESLRGELPEGYFIQWTLTFNPWSECWLKDRFFDKVDRITGCNDELGIMAITTTYKCNEWLSDADRQMFENMRLTDPDRYLVAGLGEWGLIGGQYFNQWDSSVHVCEPFEIPNTWMKFRCMDWGSFHPYACYWCAVDFDGNIWVYRELYGWGGRANQGTKETAKEVAEKIADLESPRENVAYGVLDNACWAATGVTGPTIAEEINTVLCENKLVTFQKSSKGRIEAANAIKQRLIGREDKNGKRIVGLKVFNTCVHLIRTLPTLTHDKHKPETYDTSGEDHAVDAISYGLLSRPYSPHIVPKSSGKKDHYNYKKKWKTSIWTV